jgi:hypothetical protein
MFDYFSSQLFWSGLRISLRQRIGVNRRVNAIDRKTESTSFNDKTLISREKTTGEMHFVL